METPASTAPPVPPPTPRRGGKFFLIVAVLLAGAVVVGLLTLRGRSYKALAERTDEQSIPSVQVVTPKPGPTTVTVTLPGNLTAYSEASLFARTSGYLKSWSADLGARVKQGEVMAEIAAPDVDAQLLQSQANLSQAQASLEIANLNYNRQKELLDKKVASKQDFDQTRTSLEAAQAAVKAAQANVQNLTVQQNFQKIVAPFSGVVTRRSTDVGDLISVGNDSSADGGELFHLARTDILRVFINVPQVYSSLVTVGTPADLTFVQFPGEQFPGKVTNISGAIDMASRTLLVEVQVPNDDGRLFPGAYCQVHLTLPLKHPTVVVPVNTILFRSEGLQVGVVDAGDTVQLRSVKIGQDFGSTVEIVEGLQAADRIIINPSDSLAAGAKVHVVTPKANP